MTVTALGARSLLVLVLAFLPIAASAASIQASYTVNFVDPLIGGFVSVGDTGNAAWQFDLGAMQPCASPCSASSVPNGAQLYSGTSASDGYSFSFGPWSGAATGLTPLSIVIGDAADFGPTLGTIDAFTISSAVYAGGAGIGSFSGPPVLIPSDHVIAISLLFADPSLNAFTGTGLVLPDLADPFFVQFAVLEFDGSGAFFRTLATGNANAISLVPEPAIPLAWLALMGIPRLRRRCG